MTLILAAALFAFSISILVIWTNPTRLPNQVFSIIVFALISYFICIYKCQLNISPEYPSRHSRTWFRASAIIASFFPLYLWLLRETLIEEDLYIRRVVLKSIPWVLFGIGMATICFTDPFIAQPFRSSSTNIQNVTFLIRTLGLSGAYIFIIIQTRYLLRKLNRENRIEIQFLVLNFCIVGLISVICSALGRSIPALGGTPISSYVVVIACIFAGWALANHQVFAVRDVFKSLGQRASVLLLICTGVVYARPIFDIFFPEFITLSLSIISSTAIGFVLDHKTRQWLDIDGIKLLAETRKAVIELALREPELEKLISQFEIFLIEKYNVSFAKLVTSENRKFSSLNLHLEEHRTSSLLVCDTGWITLEGIEQRWVRPAFSDLRNFMRKHELSLITVSPRESREPSLFLYLGRRERSWPFTNPEIRRLQNTVELMDNILTRSRLTMQAAAQARVEHLAMISRGLAHDLKNLITPVSSFLVHTDDRFPPGSLEAVVHADARHSVKVMTDYVREALFFAERLSPRFEVTDIGAIFKAVQGISNVRAKRRSVLLVFTSTLSEKIATDTILIQRLLVNLVSNAIDASSPNQHVAVSAEPGPPGWMRLQVADQGCGIAAEDLQKIFEPYFTTKQFGEDVRGWGLGLTICQKIVDVHEGKISVKSELGRGTIFTVDLPVSPAPVVSSNRIVSTAIA